jgi:hypothetical protein
VSLAHLPPLERVYTRHFDSDCRGSWSPAVFIRLACEPIQKLVPARPEKAPHKTHLCCSHVYMQKRVCMWACVRVVCPCRMCVYLCVLCARVLCVLLNVLCVRLCNVCVVCFVRVRACVSLYLCALCDLYVFRLYVYVVMCHECARQAGRSADLCKPSNTHTVRGHTHLPVPHTV